LARGGEVTATIPPAAALSPQSVVARSGSNFLIGMRCMKPSARAGMTAIYAFCRVADDAVDDATDAATARAHLQFWREELAAAATGAPRTEIGRALQQAVRTFGVDCAHLAAVLDGVAMDLDGAHYVDLQALEVYCYRVASAVGLACLPVMGLRSAAAERYAVGLGHALQLTNILRDLRSDAEGGRVYAPTSWLQSCGVAAEWLAGSGPDQAYATGGACAQLCARLADAASARFAAATAALRELTAGDRRRLNAARIMGAVYADLLARLRRRGGDLRAPRVRVPDRKKLWLALLVSMGAR
jgi:phytoene synthase